ncbi:hypothetical protein ACMZ7V_05220 [Gardnerella vaginalis]
MAHAYKQTSTKKQNQRQIGTTATTDYTQEAERCETRNTQPSYNTKQGNASIPAFVSQIGYYVNKRGQKETKSGNNV